MKPHRIIWYITLGAVLVAALVLTSRKVGENDHTATSRIASPEERVRIDTMMALLRQDPPVEKIETLTAVKAVAELAANAGLRCPETHYALGLARMQEKAFAAAETAFRNAIASKPDWSWPHNGLGILLANHAKNREQEAESEFRTAIRLDPDWSRPYNDLGILLRMTGRLDEAEENALTALRLDPGSVATRNNYGNLLVVRQQFDKAAPEYQKAIEQDPNHPKPYYNLACLYSLQHRAAEALPLLAKAIALNPTLREDAQRDADFDPIRNDPQFQELTRQPLPNSPQE